MMDPRLERSRVSTMKVMHRTREQGLVHVDGGLFDKKQGPMANRRVAGNHDKDVYEDYRQMVDANEAQRLRPEIMRARVTRMPDGQRDLDDMVMGDIVDNRPAGVLVRNRAVTVADLTGGHNSYDTGPMEPLYVEPLQDKRIAFRPVQTARLPQQANLVVNPVDMSSHASQLAMLFREEVKVGSRDPMDGVPGDAPVHPAAMTVMPDHSIPVEMSKEMVTERNELEKMAPWYMTRMRHQQPRVPHYNDNEVTPVQAPTRMQKAAEPVTKPMKQSGLMPQEQLASEMGTTQLPQNSRFKYSTTRQMLFDAIDTQPLHGELGSYGRVTAKPR